MLMTPCQYCRVDRVNSKGQTTMFIDRDEKYLCHLCVFIDSETGLRMGVLFNEHQR